MPRLDNARLTHLFTWRFLVTLPAVSRATRRIVPVLVGNTGSTCSVLGARAGQDTDRFAAARVPHYSRRIAAVFPRDN